jgi:hypothetical protein
MRIERKYPPNLDRIVKVFPAAMRHGIIFTYGDIIYNPSGVSIPKTLLAHEAVHAMRQKAMGVDLWWDTYIANKEFRFEEELAAHKAEYQAYRGGAHGFSRAGFLHFVAKRLSGDLYGQIATFDQCVDLIRGTV